MSAGWRGSFSDSPLSSDSLVYSVNEWDNYAVEEALQIVERVGGSVTVVSVGNPDAEETLRREMAMGAVQRAVVQGKTSIIATEVKKGDSVLRLRTEDGVPLWSGRRW